MNVNSKILTLIVPSYNMQHYLGRCLDSLIVDDEQTMNALDVIVVNDGSKDKTSEIAHGYADKCPDTFRVIDKENGNYGSCINAGLKVARGKYVRPLDADDYVVTNNLPNIIKTLREVDTDAIITDFTEVSDTCQTLNERTFGLLTANKVFVIDDSLLNYGLPMHSLTYSTTFLRNSGYRQTEGIFYSDQEWNFLPFKTLRTLYYLPLKLYQYVMGREGQSVDPSVMLKNMNHNTTILINMLECLKEVDKNTQNYKYMFRYLQSHSFYIYYTILFAKPYSLENDKLLCNTDQQMKTLSPELYDYLDKFVISFNTNPIRRWRQGKALNLCFLKVSIPLYNLYLRFRHIIKQSFS